MSWKIAGQNASSVFTYFCGGQKTIFDYNFLASLKCVDSDRHHKLLHEVTHYLYWHGITAQ